MEPEPSFANVEKAEKVQNEDSTKKDKFGATKALRNAIEIKYDILEFIGKGSYGSVSKGTCKLTGRTVAIKIMENQTDSEYDTIKLVREI